MKTFLKNIPLIIASILFLLILTTFSVLCAIGVIYFINDKDPSPATSTNATQTDATPFNATPNSPTEQNITPTDADSIPIAALKIKTMYIQSKTAVYSTGEKDAEKIGILQSGEEVVAYINEALGKNAMTLIETDTLSGYVKLSLLADKRPEDKSSDNPGSNTSSKGTVSESSADTSSQADSSTSGSSQTSNSQAGSSVASIINSASLNPIKTNNAKLDKLVQKVLASCTTSNMSTYEKVKAVYDYIIKHTTYQQNIISIENVYAFVGNSPYLTYNDSFIAYDAYVLLSTGYGVCDNYAAAFTVLTRAIGLDSYRVGGQVESYSGGYTGHAWNNVRINGKMYVFDAQIEDNDFDRNGSIRYIYFCRTDSEFAGMYQYDSYNIPESFGKFALASMLKIKTTVKFGDKKLSAADTQMKPNSSFFSSFEYSDETLEYLGQKLPKLSVTFNIVSGTAPYKLTLTVNRYKTGVPTTLFNDSKTINYGSYTFSYTPDEFGDYEVIYSLSDNSGREISKNVWAYSVSDAPIKVECITIEQFEDSFIITVLYSGGGMAVSCDVCVKDSKGQEVKSTAICSANSYLFPLKKGSTYTITATATDSNGNRDELTQKCVANNTR